MTVVMTVQTLWGFAQMNVHDTGRDLLDLGIIPLETHAARDGGHWSWWWALGQTGRSGSYSRVCTTTPIANDQITPREPHNGYLILQGGLPEVESFVKLHWK